MVSRRTRVACWIFRRDHPSRPKAMICCFFSSFKTFAMLREATYPPAAVNVLDVSSESMAAFQVFLYGRFWVFTEDNLALLAANTGLRGGEIKRLRLRDWSDTRFASLWNGAMTEKGSSVTPERYIRTDRRTWLNRKLGKERRGQLHREFQEHAHRPREQSLLLNRRPLP